MWIIVYFCIVITTKALLDTKLYNKRMMTIEEYRAAILQALLDAKNEDGTPALSEKEATEALNGFTDDELQDGILWNTPQDVADIILEG